MIKITNLHKKFDQLEVLRGIDLEIQKGEVVAVIGPSGTGKSTLLRCINYLEQPEQGTIASGEVSVDAQSSTPKEIKALRHQSAMVFQSYNLFKNMTVLDNVLQPLVTVQKMPRGKALEEARGYLKQVSLLDKENEYPSRLSGGQQQRVGIARAMAVKPQIILFDEPTAALDPSLVGEVLEVIRDLAKKHTTMLIVTHEMRFAREAADKVVFMADGQIVEQGPPEQIFGNPQNERTKNFLQLSQR